ncbi:MAG: hypothetical protein HDT22_00355 [Ruminococcus sp.]|nr:hypothetical protein [Ruminococcus sp.]
MNSQAKFLISSLFIVLIILCIILTRFYLDVTKNTENSIRDNKIDSVVKNFGEMQVFKSVNGFYGLLDSQKSVIIEPSWLEVLDVTSEMVLVSSEMHHEILIGGIDYEENVVLPFVFSSVEKLDDDYYLGTVQKDNKYIIYDKNYEPVFSESFDKIEYDNKLLAVSSENCNYYYDMAGQIPILRSAELQCNIGDLLLNWRIANQVYLAELHADDLKKMNSHVADYMKMLIADDFSGLELISSNEYFNNLIKSSRFSEINLKNINKFAFSRRESGAYDFMFVVNYDTMQEEQNISGQAEVHLYFRKNSENQMILTATDLQFEEIQPEPIAEE